jgi:drug/metabolite transporter (DMT)-like permease
MTPASLIRMLALGAIWGASFLFMRVAVPVLGPELLVLLRALLAALFLSAVALVWRRPLHWRMHGRHFLTLGLLNSALPFVLWAHAAGALPATLLSVLNATAPIWGAVVGAAWARQRPAARVLVGLVLGLAGVAVLVGVESLALAPGSGWAVAAALAASLCYGLSTTYARAAPGVEPLANAHGSMWAAALWMLPLWLATAQPVPTPTPTVAGAALALGVVCSGVAYLLYFRLLADIGPVRTLTVTFLIPVFGTLWGVVFLDERVGWHTLAGGMLVLCGTALASGWRWRRTGATGS